LKVCTQCKEKLHLDAFGSDKSRPDKKYSMCKACKNARYSSGEKKAYYEANKEHILAKQKIRNSDPIQKKKIAVRSKAYYEANKNGKRKVYNEINKEKIAAKQKARRELNKQETKAYMQEYRKKNAEAISLSKKQYNEANKEAISLSKKQYNEANKEAISLSRKQYNEANKEKIAATKRNYRIKNSSIILADNARYRAKRKGLIPSFLKECTHERNAIIKIYNLCQIFTNVTGILHHVDHMWPLDDSGPHWSGNLQILPATENHQKWSKVNLEIKVTILDSLAWAKINHEKCSHCKDFEC
jgi:hypothetical protein